MRKELRNKEIVRLHQKEGLKVKELAARFGVSKRTIHRIIRSNPTHPPSYVFLGDTPSPPPKGHSPSALPITSQRDRKAVMG